MSDDAGIHDPIQPGHGELRVGHVPDTTARGGVRLSRRAFLRGAVAGGVAIGVASLGYWGVESRSVPASAAQAAPKPSTPPGSQGYRSRPDLWSPLISVTQPGLNATAGGVMLTPATGPGPIVVDNTGSPVWIHPTAGKRALNLRVGTYREAPVLTWWEGTVALGTGQGEYPMIDETYTEVGRVRAANGLQGDLHEFITTPEGTALFTVYAPRAVPGATPVASPGASPATPQLLESIVQEVDIASGKLLFEWRSADHVSPTESYAAPPSGQPFDYFHINSIDVDSDGNLLISARHTWAVYKIDRHTGAVIWRLGGKQSDFTMGLGAQFSWQHDARRQPDGTISLFDDGSNGSKPPTENESRGVVLEVDETARTATLRREYIHTGPLSAGSQGSMQPLPNGNVVVGWGDQPYFTEFTADGTTVLDARLPDASFSYRALRFPWHGRPAELPAVAVQQGDADTTVYASWNGATEVATWVVLGGDSPDALMALGSRPRMGFETAIVVLGRPRLVAVRAIDGSGAVLAQSPLVSA
jgi:hypothetical protein